MPAVCTFWQMPSEEAKFLQYLESTGRVVAIEDTWYETPEDAVAVDLNSFRAKSASQVMLGLSQLVDFKPIFIDNGLDRGYVGPSYLQNNVLCYSRGMIRDSNYLTQANLCGEWTYLDEEKQVILDKDPEFVQWGKKVLAWLRRHASEWVEYNGYKYRATKAVKKAVEVGEIVAVPY